jgi:hypothetical protein
VKLIDLDPRWILEGGKRVGFSFLSPTRSQGPIHWRQSCYAIPSPKIGHQWHLLGKDDAECTQTCKLGVTWSITGGIETADFATLTVLPSIDGSAGGLWHGFITNGEIK